MTDLSLDQLFAEAKAAMKVQRREAFAAKAKQPTSPPSLEEPSAFANPENWIEGAGVALIHRESQTLLGNFQSFRYKFDRTIRRLVRSQSPISVAGIEEVDFGYEPPKIPLTSPRVETQEIKTLDLTLVTPALSARRVLVCVHYYNGWTARVVLVEPTTFTGAGELIQFPAGVEILPVLDRESRKAARHTSLLSAL